MSTDVLRAMLQGTYSYYALFELYVLLEQKLLWIKLHPYTVRKIILEIVMPHCTMSVVSIVPLLCFCPVMLWEPRYNSTTALPPYIARSMNDR